MIINLLGNDDPLFPTTRMEVGSSRKFTATGLKKAHWRTTTPIRRIFREAFSQAGISYFNPHSFRNTIVQLGEKVCKTPEQFKAWSQNLGHEKVLTTFLSYGEVACQRQGEIIRDLAMLPSSVTQQKTDDLAEAIVKRLNESGLTV